jgi:hypothetical protein
VPKKQGSEKRQLRKPVELPNSENKPVRVVSEEEFDATIRLILNQYLTLSIENAALMEVLLRNRIVAHAEIERQKQEVEQLAPFREMRACINSTDKELFLRILDTFKGRVQ